MIHTCTTVRRTGHLKADCCLSAPDMHVAVQDPVLDATVRELKKAFPKVQLRKVLGPSARIGVHASLYYLHYFTGCIMACPLATKALCIAPASQLSRWSPHPLALCARWAWTWAGRGTWRRWPSRRRTSTCPSSSATPATCSPASSTACARSCPGCNCLQHSTTTVDVTDCLQ
jgi:hypothetical protein